MKFKQIIAAIFVLAVFGTLFVGCNNSSDEQHSTSNGTSESKTDSTGAEVSIEKAIEIAKNYWEYSDNEENGYRIEHAVNSQAPDNVYVIVIQKYIIDHYSSFNEIWIDKNTGEPILPHYLNGK